MVWSRATRDGLSLFQTLTHFWGRQNTGGKVASVLVGGLAAGYAGLQAYSMYTTVKQLDRCSEECSKPAACTGGNPSGYLS